MNIEDILARHPILDAERTFRVKRISTRFGPNVLTLAPQPWVLALYPFVEQRPLKYFCENGCHLVLDFLRAHPAETLEVLEEFSQHVSHAIDTLVTPAESWLKEDWQQLSDAKDYIDFDQLWHPEYQRYAEHAFNHLINVLLGVRGRVAGKNYTEQTLANRVGLLRQQGTLACLTDGFESIVRNALSHGKTEFSQYGIRYVDQKRELHLYAGDLLKKFDLLVQSCHTIVVALLFFVLTEWPTVEQWGKRRLPLGFFLLAAKGAGTHPGFELNRMIPSEMAGGRKQLNIWCSTKFASRVSHQIIALYLTALLQDVGAESYDRVAVSIDCGRSIASSAFLSADRLLRARRNSEGLQVLEEVFEGSLLWHDSPHWRQRLANLGLVFRVVGRNHLNRVVEEWKRQGFVVASSRYTVRSVENRSVEGLRRLEGRVVLRDGEKPDKATARAIACHAIKKLRRKWIQGISIDKPRRFRRPPSHVWLFMHRTDDLPRRLSGSVQNNHDILVEAEWRSRLSRSRFIQIPHPDEIYRGIRLKYSPALT